MPVDWATVGTSLGVSLAGGGLAGVAANFALGIIQQRHQRSMDVSRLDLDKWQEIQRSFETEIKRWEEAGDTERANETRREHAEQEAAWRAQQGVTSITTAEIKPEGDPSLTGDERAKRRRLLEASANLNPAALSPEDHFRRGNAYFETGQYREALAAYNRALELRPDDARVVNNRGNTLWYLGRNTDALADYNRALALRPDHPDTLNNRGNALQNLKRYSEALTDYNRALALRPDHPDTLNNRGNALQNLGRYQEALADHNRALELRPDHPTTLSNRAIVLTYLGRYNEALAAYNRALELRPNHPNTLYNKACLFSRMGDYREALVWLGRAIAGDGKYSLMATEDPAFAPLRDHPQFGPQFSQLVAEDLR